MTGVPKGSSIAKDDEALLGKPSIIQPVCVLTGDRTDANHHEPPKSHIPAEMHDRIPRLSVSGVDNAHGAHKYLQSRQVRASYSDTGWWFTPKTEEAVRYLNRRRVANGLTRVRVGMAFPANVVSEFDDGAHLEVATSDDGDELFAIEAEIRSCKLEVGKQYHQMGAWLEAAADVFTRRYSKREAASRLITWARDNLSVSKSTVTKCRAIWALPGTEDICSLPLEKAYLVSRAAKAGADPHEAASTAAVTLLEDLPAALGLTSGCRSQRACQWRGEDGMCRKESAA